MGEPEQFRKRVLVRPGGLRVKVEIINKDGQD